jgi:predicted transcriptional regulator
MDDYLKMAFEMVKAQATTRPMTSAEMMAMAKELADGMKALSAGGEVVPPAEAAAPSIDGKKSIKEGSVTCCECGKKMKLITKKHLEAHGLTKAEYLAKHGLKKGTSLMAKGLSRARKEKMTEMKLWERRGAGKKAAAVAAGEAKPAAAKKAAAPAKKAAPKKAATPKAEKKD